MTPEEIKEITERIRFLETKGIEKPIENSRLNESIDLDKKQDFREIIALYKRLVDSNYPVQSQIIKSLEDHLLIDDAINMGLIYFHDNLEQGKIEKSELLKRLANVIYWGGDYLDEMLEFESDNKNNNGKEALYEFPHINKDSRMAAPTDKIKVDYVAEKEFEFNLALKLLTEANKVFPSAETYCLIGEMYLDNKDYEKAEEYIKKAIQTDKTYAKSYAQLTRIVEAKEGKESAISVLEHVIEKEFDCIDLRILLIELCMQKFNAEKNKDSKLYYLGIIKAQTAIVKEQFSYKTTEDLIFDEKCDADSEP